MELIHSDGSAIVVDRDMLRIGVSEICEIQLDHGPLLHSVIHHESGVIWIEADIQAAELFVNGRNCRRMALRHGDVINICGLEMTLRYRSLVTPEEESDEVADVTEMSAEELCDRILEEQTEINRYESARAQGLRDLMAAMKSVHETELQEAELLPAVDADEAVADCERLLDQIREMSDMMNDSSSHLDDCEAELVAATTLLQEAQDRVTHQIEELINQFGDLPRVNEMRASA